MTFPRFQALRGLSAEDLWLPPYKICGALLGVAVRLLDDIFDTPRFPLLHQAEDAHGTRRINGQNVHLFCPSEGVATVFRGAVDYDNLNRTPQLRTDQSTAFLQTIDYPTLITNLGV